MKKFWNGVLAFGPVSCLLIAAGSAVLPGVLVFLLAIISSITGEEPSEIGVSIIAILLPMLIVGAWFSMFLALVWTIADIVIFCIYAIKNSELDEGKKAIWCCLFIALQFMTFPVYWWIYLRKENIFATNEQLV